MSDSDDYFDDSFVLDETALALLQHEEEKFYSTQAPPSTVVKTAQRGSSGKEAIRRKLVSHDDSDDDDDQFDVIVRDDGSYAFGGHIGTPILQHSRTDIPSTSARVASETDNVQSSNVQSSNKTRLSSVIPPVNFKASAFLEPPTATVLPPGLTKISKPSRLHNESSVVDILKGAVDDQLQAEVARLKTQLTELNRLYTVTHNDLKEAQETRFAKEGEVSILRKGLEKVTQDHAADIAKLKAAKEAAELKQIQMQKEMKDEAERLRVQFIFKQHELETSVRKPTWSVRSKRAQGLPETPIPIPSAMKSWTTNAAGRAIAIPQTPSRVPIHQTPFKTPPHRKKARTIVQPTFAGFENVTQPQSPNKSPTSRRTTGATLMKQSQQGQAALSSGEIAPIFGEQDVFMDHVQLAGSSSPMRGHRNTSPSLGDIEGGDTMEIDDNVPHPWLDEDSVPTTGIEWRDELRNLIFTHSPGVFNPSLLTLHTLFSVAFSPPVSVSVADAYREACSSLLEGFGIHGELLQYDALISKVALALVSITRMLLVTTHMQAFISTFKLLTSLCICIPSFTDTLLLIEDAEGACTLIPVICNVIQNKMQPMAPEFQGETYSQVSMTVIELLEALFYTAGDNLVDRLHPLVRGDNLPMILLNEKQPEEIISQTLRLLVTAATHFSLFRALLSQHDGEKPQDPHNRIPLLDRLSAFLVDKASLNRRNINYVLNIIALLSIAHAHSITILLESNMLITSLVYLLCDLSVLIWDEDDRLMDSPEEATSTVLLMSQLLLLLHTLLYAKPGYNLRYKLHHAPNRQLSGLEHHFIVMISRWSFAETPDWLTPEAKAYIENVNELALELIDLVVESGPETDSLFHAYQDEVSVSEGQPLDANTAG